MDLKAVFDKHEDEHLYFKRIENPRHSRPDICAFLMLHDLVPIDGRDMVVAAEHDQIWLGVNCKSLAEKASEQHIIDLRRCGVWYDGETDSLSMFV